MKVLLVSNDITLNEKIKTSGLVSENEFSTYDLNPDPLSVMTQVCSVNPRILIMDDDFLQPNTAQILKSIKKIKNDVATIFLTSDSSIELGRKISPLGVQFYAIKPISDQELRESLESIIKLKTNTTN